MQTAFAVKDGVPALRFETRSTASMPNPWNLWRAPSHAAQGKTSKNESRLMAANGPPIKFTPARFEQIRNLVERGMSREQIAETIGVTVGSLQVTCSRHGISLKRPKLNNGVAHAPRSRNDTPAAGSARPACASAAISGHRSNRRAPLSEGVLGGLAIDAPFRNLSISDLTVNDHRGLGIQGARRPNTRRPSFHAE